MIAEIRFKNMFSFRDEAILSFEADRSKDMESYHVVELGGGVRLLKVAVIYGHLRWSLFQFVLVVGIFLHVQ